MNDEEIAAAKAEIKVKEDALSVKLGRAKRIYEISEVLMPPKGIIRKRCPKCGKRLNKETLFDGHLTPGKYYDYFVCECDYEYATKY